MSKQVKLIAKLRSKPKDFTWQEAVSVMRAHDFELHNGTGSRRFFKHKITGRRVGLHEPHPENTLKAYALDLLIEAIDN